MKNLSTKNSETVHRVAQLFHRFFLHAKACLGVRRLDAAFISPQQTIQKRRQAAALQNAYAREKCLQHKHINKFACFARFSALKRAFTLVEVMIAISVFTMVIGGTMAAFFACNKLWQSTSLAMQASREANTALSRIIYGMGTNDGLRTAAQVTIVNTCAGIYQHMYPPTSSSLGFAETNYPVPANANNHWVNTAYSGNDGSWRMVISNYDGRVTWIDYNINARNIVFWPDVTDTTRASRESIANYVSTAAATVTNGGLELSMTIERRHGSLLSTNNVNSFVRLRNM